MTCGLADDVDDASIALSLHRRQDCLYHGEKAKHLVAQLLFENLNCGAFYRCADMCAGIVN